MASADSAGPSSAKIIVVGPQGCGKTVISNFLVGYAEAIQADETITPTAGCRILEFEAEAPSSSFGSDRFPIELWDCSGDQKCGFCCGFRARGAVVVVAPTRHLGSLFDPSPGPAGTPTAGRLSSRMPME